METKVEALQDNQKKITVTVDAKEVDARIGKQYKDFAKKYNFPGFRKGKAPRPVIDNVLGKEAVVGTVTDDLVNSLFPLAMDEHDLIAMSKPEFELETELVQAGKDFTFSAVLETRPEYTLDNYDPVTVQLPPATATDAEIDAQIEELRSYYVDFKDSPANTKVKKDSFVDIALKATKADGEEIESLTTDSRLYELGRGLFPEAFDEELLGLKKGDQKTFTINIDYSTIGMGLEETGDITFDVTINVLKKQVKPELTDEWAKETAGFETVDALRETIAASINMQKEQVMPRLRETEALYNLQERLQGEAPAALVEAEEANLLQNFFMQIQQAGMTYDAYLQQAGLTPDGLKEDIKKQAADVVKQDLALDAWARNAGIEITDTDISEEFIKSGAEDPAALEQQWRENGQIAMLRAGMRRQRALEQILDTLVVEDLPENEDAE